MTATISSLDVRNPFRTTTPVKFLTKTWMLYMYSELLRCKNSVYERLIGAHQQRWKANLLILAKTNNKIINPYCDQSLKQENPHKKMPRITNNLFWWLGRLSRLIKSTNLSSLLRCRTNNKSYVWRNQAKSSQINQWTSPKKQQQPRNHSAIFSENKKNFS